MHKRQIKISDLKTALAAYNFTSVRDHNIQPGEYEVTLNLVVDMSPALKQWVKDNDLEGDDAVSAAIDMDFVAFDESQMYSAFREALDLPNGIDMDLDIRLESTSGCGNPDTLEQAYEALKKCMLEFRVLVTFRLEAEFKVQIESKAKSVIEAQLVKLLA